MKMSTGIVTGSIYWMHLSYEPSPGLQGIAYFPDCLPGDFFNLTMDYTMTIFGAENNVVVNIVDEPL